MFKKNYKNTPNQDVLFDLDVENASSAFDFTGSVPIPPQSEAERESYLDVLNFSPETIDASSPKKEETNKLN